LVRLIEKLHESASARRSRGLGGVSFEFVREPNGLSVARALPHDFPKWKTVYTVFWRWRKRGLWKQIHEALCRLVRKAADKKPTPSVAIIDSQSIRTAETMNAIPTRVKP
jgi:Putative transposase of IS4/5 family (DUF4096)